MANAMPQARAQALKATRHHATSLKARGKASPANTPARRAHSAAMTMRPNRLPICHPAFPPLACPAAATAAAFAVHAAAAVAVAVAVAVVVVVDAAVVVAALAATAQAAVAPVAAIETSARRCNKRAPRCPFFLGALKLKLRWQRQSRPVSWQRLRGL
jgi:hypothetical protein